MNYCSKCGARLVQQIPVNDNRQRHVCLHCDTIHYENPKIVAGCIPFWQEQVLLCRRAIDPRKGKWTLPAGFMELEESTVQAAVRETVEEANARVEVDDLYTIINLPHIGQVYIMFRAHLLDLDFAPGEESEAVQLFDAVSVPWHDLAFTTIRYTLQFFFDDMQSGHFTIRTGDLVNRKGRLIFEAGPGTTITVR